MGSVLVAQQGGCVVDDVSVSKKTEELRIRLHEEEVARLGKLAREYKYKEIDVFDAETVTLKDLSVVISELKQKRLVLTGVLLTAYMGGCVAELFLFHKTFSKTRFVINGVAVGVIGYFAVKKWISLWKNKRTVSSLENLKKRIKG